MENDIKMVVQNTKKRNVKWWCVIGAIAVIFAAVIFFIFERTPSITQDEVLQIVNNCGYNTYELNQTVYSAEIQSLNHFESYWNKDAKQMVVAFDMCMENEEVSVEKQCYAQLSKEKDRWLVKYWDDTVNNIFPRQGVIIPSDDELQGVVQSFYPEINWGYTYDGVFQSDIDYDYTIDVQIISRETKLDEKTDVISYEYSFETNTVAITGTFTEHYEFIDGLGWTYLYTDEKQSDLDWRLEGMWSLDIYTYYVDVYIKEMKWDEQMAVIEARGSSVQDSGIPDTYYVPFLVKEDGIYFTTFQLKKEITLIARYEDMYYLIPNMFTDKDPVEKAAGGKSQ